MVPKHMNLVCNGHWVSLCTTNWQSDTCSILVLFWGLSSALRPRSTAVIMACTPLPWTQWPPKHANVLVRESATKLHCWNDRYSLICWDNWTDQVWIIFAATDQIWIATSMMGRQDRRGGFELLSEGSCRCSRTNIQWKVIPLACVRCDPRDCPFVGQAGTDGTSQLAVFRRELWRSRQYSINNYIVDRRVI